MKYLVDHDGNKKRAELKSSLLRRQINRLINVYKEKVTVFSILHQSHFYKKV